MLNLLWIVVLVVVVLEVVLLIGFIQWMNSQNSDNKSSSIGKQDDHKNETDYEVSFRVNGQYVIKVSAEGISAAKEKAELIMLNNILNKRFDEMTNVDTEPLTVIDTDGNYLWTLQDN